MLGTILWWSAKDKKTRVVKRGTWTQVEHSPVLPLLKYSLQERVLSVLAMKWCVPTPPGPAEDVDMVKTSPFVNVLSRQIRHQELLATRRAVTGAWRRLSASSWEMWLELVYLSSWAVSWEMRFYMSYCLKTFSCTQYDEGVLYMNSLHLRLLMN